jgi:Tetracyclin repressor-like, C-terminal domain
VLDELVATGAITSEARVRAEYVAWSSVHGIATLLAGGSLRDLPPSERDTAIDRVVRSVTFLTRPTNHSSRYLDLVKADRLPLRSLPLTEMPISNRSA